MDPRFLLDMPPLTTRQEFSRKDTILYALGVGAGQDPAGDDLRFVYEDGLSALPTYPAVLAYPGFWMREPQYGIDWKRVLHVEQSVELHRPLPVEGRVRSELRVDEILDKGADKGAILFSSRRIYGEDDGEPIATLRQASILRGNGGFGGSPGSSARPAPLPQRPPDHVVSLATRAEQALIYRLNGDDNPLHVDPGVAAEAGFPRPILHGLCTFGIALRMLGPAFGRHPADLRDVTARLSAPVLPGDAVTLRGRASGDGYAFDLVVGDRQVLKDCRARFAPPNG